MKKVRKHRKFLHDIDCGGEYYKKQIKIYRDIQSLIVCDKIGYSNFEKRDLAGYMGHWHHSWSGESRDTDVYFFPWKQKIFMFRNDAAIYPVNNYGCVFMCCNIMVRKNGIKRYPSDSFECFMCWSSADDDILDSFHFEYKDLEYWMGWIEENYHKPNFQFLYFDNLVSRGILKAY